jgi:hypothetical protein
MSTGFSLESYRRLLDLALNRGWSFRPFDDATVSPNDKIIFLRHDVDYTVQAAVDLAKVNSDARVRGTFFLLLRGDVYNLLSPPNMARAHEIAALGQDVALHFALPSPSPSDAKSLVAAIEQDYRSLQRELPMLSPVFSWHNPTPAQTGISATFSRRACSTRTAAHSRRVRSTRQTRISGLGSRSFPV